MNQCIRLDDSGDDGAEFVIITNLISSMAIASFSLITGTLLAEMGALRPEGALRFSKAAVALDALLHPS